MSGKRRVYEVARELGMDNKAFLAVLETVGVSDVKNHMSVLTADDESRVKRHLNKGTAELEAGASASGDRPRVVRRAVVVRRRKEGGNEELDARPTGASTLDGSSDHDRGPSEVIGVVDDAAAHESDAFESDHSSHHHAAHPEPVESEVAHSAAAQEATSSHEHVPAGAAHEAFETSA